MHRFEDEIKTRHPEWFENETQSQSRVIKNRTIKVRQPKYILPMLLTMVALAFYVSFMHIQRYQYQWKHEADMNNLEMQINEIESILIANREAINLVGILHNENFASMRASTGNRNILFINKDWKINRMPYYLILDDKDRDIIQKRYIVQPKKQVEEDAND